MESVRWRYHPEFRINVTLDGQLPDAGVQLFPTEFSRMCMKNYGVIARTVGGTIICSVKQYHNGVTWIPTVPLSSPCVFGFVLTLSSDGTVPALDFYAQGNSTFGRRILYLNNLSSTGVIDSNLIGSNVRLTPSADVALTDAGSVCGGIPAVLFTPGTFTQFRAGKIRAGAPISFGINQPVNATDQRASLNMTLQPKGSYVLRLEGGTPVQERVIIDPIISGKEVSGVIEIFRDTWHTPAQPRNYNINFTT